MSHGGLYEKMKKKNGEKILYLNHVIALAGADQTLRRSIGSVYCCTGKQAELLEKILLGLKQGIHEHNSQSFRNQVYQYGSMVKDRDLFARQMFLLLFDILETV